jgi:hypothetical protein
VQPVMMTITGCTDFYVSMAYGVYFIPASAVAQQIGLGTTSMLTLIASMLALGSTLPKIPYLTRADRFFVARRPRLHRRHEGRDDLLSLDRAAPFTNQQRIKDPGSKITNLL